MVYKYWPQGNIGDFVKWYHRPIAWVCAEGPWKFVKIYYIQVFEDYKDELYENMEWAMK